MLASLATDRFEEVFQSTAKVHGLTHDYYKYPARFSPNFARFIIDELSEPGDWVLDPFMGGGTTIVEAVASGRQAIGSDVNSLARFVTLTKTTPLSNQDISGIRYWMQSVHGLTKDEGLRDRYIGNSVRNLPAEVYPFFAEALKLASRLRFPRQRRFARCALLRVGQRTLDSRLHLPESSTLPGELEKRVEQMLSGLQQFVTAARYTGTNKNKISGRRRLVNLSAANGRLVNVLKKSEIAPKLVLTSPPYPGVHVLYHRWQVLGRRETPAPYWLANQRDGHGEAYYTMGSRSALGMRNYFATLSTSLSNLRRMVSQDAYIVQLVSFSDTNAQLQMYLEVMDRAGFKEASVRKLGNRRVRSVPNRKWYNYRRQDNDASREVLLVHRPATAS